MLVGVCLIAQQFAASLETGCASWQVASEVQSMKDWFVYKVVHCGALLMHDLLRN